VTSFRRKDLFPNDHACYAGELRPSAHDIAGSTRRESTPFWSWVASLGDVETGAASVAGPREHRRTPHPCARGLRNPCAVFPHKCRLQAHPVKSARTCRSGKPPVERPDVVVSVDPGCARGAIGVHGAGAGYGAQVNLSLVFASSARELPKSALIANGAGNYAAMGCTVFLSQRVSHLCGAGSGAMGYAVPAADCRQNPSRIRGKKSSAWPRRRFFDVFAELATAAALDLRIVFLVVNNGPTEPSG